MGIDRRLVVGLARAWATCFFVRLSDPDGHAATQAAALEKPGCRRGFTTFLWIMPIAISVLMYFVIPGLLACPVPRESVRATCERRDPRSAGPTTVPCPCLLSLLYAFSVISAFSMSACLPVFGVYLSGSAGVAVAVLIACLFAWVAWGTYRLQPAAWWGALVVVVVGTADGVFAFAAMDISEMYKKMGIAAEMLESMRKAGLFDILSRYGPWLSLTSGLAALGYLMFLRRYFFGAKVGAPESALGSGSR